MIDDEREVTELIESLNDHLPVPAFATPALVKVVRQHGAEIKEGESVQIDSVLYLGDMGGIACAIAPQDGEAGVVTSLTHLWIDTAHPLAERIQAYQTRRSLRLEPTRSSRKARAHLAASRKRKTRR